MWCLRRKTHTLGGEAMYTAPTLRSGCSAKAASAAMPRRQKSGEDNPKRRGCSPPFWSLGGAGGEIETPPAFSLGGSKGGDSLLKENLPLCPVQRHRRCLSLPRRARETPSPVGQIKKVQLFLKNPLDKWAPRAIMQPTSEELQTYDGEK